MSNPVSVVKPPVESKVKAGAIGAYLGSVAGLAVLEALGADVSILAPLPDMLEALVVSLIPGLIAFAAAFRAKHTFRKDLGEQAGGVVDTAAIAEQVARLLRQQPPSSPLR